MSFEAGNEHPALKGIDEHYKVMTFMETTSDEMHNSLNDVIEGQTHYRLVRFFGKFLVRVLSNDCVFSTKPSLSNFI